MAETGTAGTDLAETGSAETGSADRRHGRTTITPRAIRAVVSAVTATELGTPAGSVGVELGDDDGALRVTATAPVRLRSLAGTSAAGHSAGGTPPGTLALLTRARTARTTIHRRVQQLTGSSVGTVDLRLASALIDESERVT